jgi:Xaa-Pro dipeptidase
MKKVLEAQKRLKEQGLDGWLMYDFNHSNPLALEFLDISPGAHLSRRFFYWIPIEGDPIALLHQIEPYVLDHMPGTKKTYQTREDLQSGLQELLKASDKIAMEYSPYNALPYVSKVDAGTFEMVINCGVKIFSSGPFLQCFTALLSDEQQLLHKEAGNFLNQLADETFEFLFQQVASKKPVSEYDLQQWVLKRVEENGFKTDYAPICAFGVHTADPHYSPEEKNSALIAPDQLILLDFVVKKNVFQSVYADITRMGFSGKKVLEKYAQAFCCAKAAQKAGFDFIKQRFSEGKEVQGYEVDQVCRKLIQESGYGKNFTHRTGHNIDARSVHGSGAHLDGFETHDDRPLLPNMCFTIEPGIYFSGEWGVRVEYDVLIHSNHSIEVTSGVQEHICIM